jgi:gas vesicle protein
MSNDPDEIRYDIERTRSDLSSNVDALTDRVSPSRVVERQKSRVRATVGSWRDTVMGSADAATDTTRERMGDVKDAVASAPDQVRERTAGSPLAAGLIAFGVGLVASAVFPSTRAEQQAAQAVKEKAEPVAEQAKQAASEVAGNLREPAKQAAARVTDTAKDAGDRVRSQAQDSGQDVADRAQDAKETVQDSARGGQGSGGSAAPNTSSGTAYPGTGTTYSGTQGTGAGATWTEPTTFEPEETEGDPGRPQPPVPPL